MRALTAPRAVASRLVLSLLAVTAPGCAGSVTSTSQPAVPRGAAVSIPTPLRLAVLDFENPIADPGIEKLRIILPDLILSDIAGRGPFTVVERKFMAKVQSELTLQSTGAVADDQIARLGALSGATALLTGRVFRTDGSTARIEARLIGVETGEVLATFSAAGLPTDLTGLAGRVSLQLLASLGVDLYPSERLYLSVSQDSEYHSAGLDAPAPQPANGPPSHDDAGSLFWRVFSTAEMVRAEDRQGIALLANQEILCPNPESIPNIQPSEITVQFSEAFNAQARRQGLVGLATISSLDNDGAYRVLLVPKVSAVSIEWDCPWYSALDCRLLKPRYAAYVRGKVAVIDNISETYWESTVAIGAASASTREGALLRAYENLAWKWSDLLVKANILRPL